MTSRNDLNLEQKMNLTRESERGLNVFKQTTSHGFLNLSKKRSIGGV